ncbi:MAG: hypothetical protein H3C27_09015 [Opitutaceae bacterium]|nr:hypothetical protein [Opitutaceae bacterium]
MSAAAASAGRSGWAGAWPDALAFAGGLSLAWLLDWETTDLVWSLWLSSLVVGYATILWFATEHLRDFVVSSRADRTPGAGRSKLLGGGLILFGTLFTVAFFTVHFGGFHLGHSVFLSIFFPIVPGTDGGGSWPAVDTYWEVLRRYGIFLPVAFLAERGGFVSKSKPADGGAITLGDEKIYRPPMAGRDHSKMMAPYKNVVRMHLLIFFFAGAHFARLDHFWVYAVVYAVYFFPWRLLKRPKVADDAVVT